MILLSGKNEYADVTELADVQASDTCGYYFLVGSSPIVRTKIESSREWTFLFVDIMK